MFLPTRWVEKGMTEFKINFVEIQPWNVMARLVRKACYIPFLFSFPLGLAPFTLSGMIYIFHALEAVCEHSPYIPRAGVPNR